MGTLSNWPEPSHLGDLRINVDDRDDPKLVILLRGRFEILRVVPYGPLADLEEALVKAVVQPEEGVVKFLVTALASKLAPPKAGWAA